MIGQGKEKYRVAMWLWKILGGYILGGYILGGNLVGGYIVRGGQLLEEDGQTVHSVFGMNWYGMETELRVMEGLWAHDMRFYFDLLSRKRINTIRVPFALEGIKSGVYERPIGVDYISQCTECPVGANTYDILDLMFRLGDEYRIDIVMDMHQLHFHSTSQLWYDRVYTADDLVNGWISMVNRYPQYSSFAFMDIYNEPHGVATVNTGNATTDWDQFIIDFIRRPEFEKKLVWVNGIAWGQDMRNLTRLQTLPPEQKDRLIMSPHCYGPTLTFLPNNTQTYLWRHLDSYFGYLRNDFPIIVGEWGGNQDSPKDILWMEMFVAYLMQNEFGSCFWALNPNSKDVKGYLLPDWTTIDPYKGQLLDRLLWGG